MSVVKTHTPHMTNALEGIRFANTHTPQYNYLYFYIFFKTFIANFSIFKKILKDILG